MPGLVGVCSEREDIASQSILNKLVESLKHRQDYQIELIKYPPFWGSLILIKELAKPKKIIEDRDFIIFLDGELYNNQSQFNDAQYILTLFKQHKNFSFLSDVEGIFSFCLYDKASQKVYLAVDKFGLKSLYYAKLDKGFVFASELKAILRHPQVKKAIDWKTIGDLLFFSFATGDKTLIKGAKLLPQASVLGYSLKEDSLELSSYWDTLSVFTPKGEYQDIALNEIAEIFREGVHKRVKNRELLGISLSGGLDSRSILAALGGEAQGLPSYTLGLPSCEDERLSARMAQIAGTRHEFLPITEDSLRDFVSLAKTLVYYSDGFYFPHESTEKVALDYFKRAPFKILFRGHGGELAKASLAFPVQVDKQVLNSDSPLTLTEIFLRKANLVLPDIAPEKFFLIEDLKRLPARIKEESLSKISSLLENLSPGDVFLHFYLFEYMSRQVVSSLNIFRTQIEVRLPFTDEVFLKKLFSLPIEKRWEGEIHIEIVKTCMPALVKVPNSNTGAPLDAGKLRLWLTDKFNSLLKKLSVPGFRHYTEFDKWQRKYFREALEQILFDKKTLDRGIYEPRVLKEVFDAHITGKKNYARFLGTAAGLELWFREFLD
ncbi:asparagine synthase [Thermodesulfatator indicus DSM 15286]|uniref:asparagine synthase (glutamine-hydrolyzing) n=1 Tax=Thermodesulfatator indicus (strain DSM 15286 / JCM 11887 / CIR29812) TaxID=667014 RepID=F8ABJ7_THEID|nr:asparagine synthetase B family protein [Thermodesulfatator indicus]AEH45594.1 asparagine synthase [Thermodesulfatator indicus DSM 15286]